MAYVMNDRVREQVSGFAGGAGALTLPVSAVSGFQTFLAGWGASGTGEYAIVSGAQWEVGLGTLNAGGTTLTRTTVYNGSSGAGVAVNFTGGTMDCFGNIPAELAHYLNMQEITVASAATCDIGAVRGSKILISGAVTITSFGTSKNRRRFVRFSGAPILTHNATTLILPGAVNIQAAAGDTAIFESDASGNWRCYAYNFVSAKNGFQVFTASGTFTAPAWTQPGTRFKFTITGGGGGGGSANFNASAAGGGGGGATCILNTTGLTAGTGYTVTVGTGGTAGSTGGNGGAGGTSSVVIGATTYSGAGGVGAVGTTTGQSLPGGVGGTATNGSLNVSGGMGSPGSRQAVIGGNGGSSVWGSGGGGAYDGGVAGTDAVVYGTGGGGSAIHNTGGAGKAGVVVVEWVL